MQSQDMMNKVEEISSDATVRDAAWRAALRNPEQISRGWFQFLGLFAAAFLFSVIAMLTVF